MPPPGPMSLTTYVDLVVTGADGADGAEVPYMVVAVTVNVYAVPGVSPVTVKVPALGSGLA